ncbi:MAG TPA: GNAT family N-acetyltransferase [Bacteroidetes bacterium]|nr:GNAT family N-acetyltransferase [Bacteroidota bacterium]
MQIYPASDRKDIYRNFCKKQKDVPVFIQPWWLDLDAGAENWDVVLVENNKQIVGAFPFCFTKLKFFKGIGMPPVAPYQGYYIVYKKEQTKVSTRLAWEQKIIKSIFTNLPEHTFFYQHFFPEIKNWMPLYWLGYKQTSKYSFLIKNIKHPANVFSGFEQRARKAIRKAENILTVSEETNSGGLIDLIQLTYQKQNINPPYDFNKLKKLTEEAVAKKVAKIYVAKDGPGNIHAASFAVWHRSRAYYIIQASQPKYISEGGASLLVWHAIKDASEAGLEKFDFTGSMMPNIEKFLRSFGAVPVQRHYISKENGFLFYWMMRVKEYVEGR